MLSVEYLPAFRDRTLAVIDRLQDLGLYRFNPVTGEAGGFLWDDWRDGRRSLHECGQLLAADKPHVLLTTSLGEIELELDDAKAPVTVANFLGYVDAGYYNGTVFHRVIPNFMIQGGGFTADMQQKETRAPIQNEAGNGLDMGKGKNVALGRLREATDLNVPGQPFAMAMFPGRLAKIKVTQRPGNEPDQVYNDVRGVTKAG